MHDFERTEKTIDSSVGAGNTTPIVVCLTVGLLAAIVVWSPLTGSALKMSFVAGMCSLGIFWVSRFTPDVTSKGVLPLVVTAIIYSGLAVCSIWAASSGLTWMGWVMTIAAGPLVVTGMVAVSRCEAAPSAAS